MAGWYKIVGFSFFTAQFPNICFAYFTYLIIAYRLYRNRAINSEGSILMFTIGFWFANSLFWIFCCGRVEVLCLLFVTGAIFGFIETYEFRSRRHWALFAFCSFCVFATGFEGVLALSLFILVYSLFDIRKSITNISLYVTHVGMYLASFVGVLFYMAYHNCAKAFIRTTFGFSYSIQSLINFVETGTFNFVNNVPLDKSMSLVEKISSLTIDGLLDNKEWWFFTLLNVCIYLVIRFRNKENIPNIEKTFFYFSTFSPFIFIIAGRYAIYYTWVAYIPALCSFVFLCNHISHYERWLSLFVSALLIIWFVVSPDRQHYKMIDYSRKIDTKHISNIKEANLIKEGPIYVPYEWYYYLVGSRNLFVEGSGAYPKDLKYIVTKEAEVNDDLFKCQLLRMVGEYYIYEVLFPIKSDEYYCK